MVTKTLPQQEEYFLDKFLSKEHREAGIHLKEDYPDGVILLSPKNEPVYFSDHAVLEEILFHADQILEWIRSGIQFERAR